MAILWLLLPLSCAREELKPAKQPVASLPVGTPLMLTIKFGAPDFMDVKIGTKAEAARADEARVHDLYVMLFDTTDPESPTYGEKFYGRYFTYEHQVGSLNTLDANSIESWYVQNSENSAGAVKIATESRTSVKLVMLANVSNTITSIDHTDPIEALAAVDDLDDLNDLRVTLEQEIVNRSDIFLMMGVADGINTGTISWGSFVDDDDDPQTPDVAQFTLGGANSDQYQLKLYTIDAKVKFCIKFDNDYIDTTRTTLRHWWVHNIPSECFLIPRGSNPTDMNYFDTQSAFFEGTERINGDTWHVFSFYMLENRQDARNSIENLTYPLPERLQNTYPYYLREAENDASQEDGDYIFAPDKGTYVKFNMLLGLKSSAITVMVGDGNGHALTSEAMYTVHLGNFIDSNSGAGSRGHNYDNYTVERSNAYTYYVTIKNSTAIYDEVMGPSLPGGDKNEFQPGQEGSVMLSTDEIIDVDAHYAYHSMTFRYNRYTSGKNVSWYIKTPFDEGGAEYDPDTRTWSEACSDYLWVKFGLNAVDGVSGTYSEKRVAYPGDDSYDPNWNTHSSLKNDPNHPLLNIHQLFGYIISQTEQRNAWLDAKAAYAAGEGDDPGAYTGDFILDASMSTGKADNGSTDWVDESHEYVIRITAFIDEYYYEKDPTLGPDAPADPDLWRRFVNKDPRELHILSDANYSDDGQSDVITSSHSIVQKSIQTFYNTYSPDLNSLWGTEHVDEMAYYTRHEKDPAQEAWTWWPDSSVDPLLTTRDLPDNSIKPNSDDNGRWNTAAIWGVKDYTSWDVATAPVWEDYNDGTDHVGMLDYSVDNDHPELKEDYQFLAYSCLTRNRDNNGNHVIDPDEVRWYTASINQIIGMWVGNESLSPSARLYQPKNKNNSTDGREWRAWVISSTASSITDPKVIRAEEGANKSSYKEFTWMNNPLFTAADRHQVSSVRCVRNIGTFNDGGTITDISYAPLNQMVDEYYESPAGFNANGKVNANADGTYTLKFTRLDPRSLREYTSVDFPYHEEYSIHNCVYMELNMQDPDNYIYADGSIPGSLTEEQLNDAITNTGHNTYCPAGYRLPNMTELLLMAALQPDSYWSSSKEYPCRTYFSRGIRGSKATTGENLKIGWGYRSSGKRFNMFNSASHAQPTHITGLRCVRDNNCTGDINGTISIPNGNNLHMGEEFDININFSSMGSAINTLNLALVYVTSSGAEDTKPIPTTGLKLSGVSIQNATVKWTIPSDLSLLGNMYIRAEVINNYGTRKVVEAPIRVISPVLAAVRLLPCDYNVGVETLDNPNFPIILTATSTDVPISSWSLTIIDPDGEREVVSNNTLGHNGDDNKHWSQIFDFSYSMSTLITGTYSFQLDVVTGDLHTRSNLAEMDVLRVNYQHNPGTTGVDDGVNTYDYHTATDITNKWEPDVVNGIDILNGDFVEANFDISSCTYLEVQKYDSTNDKWVRDDNATIGRDNLISVGITDTDHNTKISVPYVYHISYPSHDGDASSTQNWLRANISTSAGASNGVNYKAFTGGSGTGFVLQSGSNYKPDITKRQHFRIDRYGAFWNNQKMETSAWGANAANASASLARIQASDVLYIGSTNDVHRSRARCCFVRAVRNNTVEKVLGGGSDFEDDPINGGSL